MNDNLTKDLTNGLPNGLPEGSGKRDEYLSWEDYFMSVAFLSAMRSKDPSTQVLEKSYFCLLSKYFR